jgi:hypothetical protein
MSPVLASTATESVKVTPATSATTTHEFRVSDLVSTLAIDPIAHPEPNLPAAIQADLGLEQNPSVSLLTTMYLAFIDG